MKDKQHLVRNMKQVRKTHKREVNNEKPLQHFDPILPNIVNKNITMLINVNILFFNGYIKNY